MVLTIDEIKVASERVSNGSRFGMSQTRSRTAPHNQATAATTNTPALSPSATNALVPLSLPSLTVVAIFAGSCTP